jgi:hypothetical protein
VLVIPGRITIPAVDFQQNHHLSHGVLVLAHRGRKIIRIVTGDVVNQLMEMWWLSWWGFVGSVGWDVVAQLVGMC